MQANLSRLVIELPMQGDKAFVFEDPDTGKAYAVPHNQIAGWYRNDDGELVVEIRGSYTFAGQGADTVETLLNSIWCI